MTTRTSAMTRPQPSATDLKALNAELLAALKSIHDRQKPFVVTYQHQSDKDALRWAIDAIAKAEGTECTTPK